MFFKERTLEEYLGATKKIKLHEMTFLIKKIDVLDFCTGAKVSMAVYDTYKVNKTPDVDVSMNKVKSHYSDVLCAGLVKPALCRKPEDGKTLVDNLLTDWELASELYSAILEFSYGKKNWKLLISQGKNS